MTTHSSILGASLEAQMVKNLPIMQETQVQALDQEKTLKKGMATHSSILAWRIPWTEEPGKLQSIRSQRVEHDWVTFHFHFHSHIITSSIIIVIVSGSKWKKVKQKQ